VGGIDRSFWATTFFFSLVAEINAAPLAAASAATEAACKQNYAAKQDAGQAGGLNEADYLKACLARKIPADPKASGAGSDADTDLAKKTENPIADLISVPFNNYSTFNYGGRGTFNLLEIQPVIPIHLTPDWNVITRTVVPVVWTPDLSPIPTVSVGIAPTDLSAFLTPKNETNGWLWGVGPVVQIPTITSADLGSNVWGGGPTAVVVHTGDKIVAGALANAIWSFGGTKGPGGNSYNTSLFEPFFNYNFGHGWYVYSDPNIVANWQARGTNKWTVPIGGGAGRIIRLGGKLPIKLSAGLFYNVVQPTVGGRWVLNTDLTLIF
jgi:hypothetical protein